MVEIHDLSFGYKGKLVFDGMELALPPGSICGLLGVNGAGKSTLLKLMAGLLFPDSGAIRALGRTPRLREPSFLADVFMLPEDLYLPNVGSRTYVETRGAYYPRFDADLFSRYAQTLEVPEEEALGAMSYGQKKKFLLAFGLATRARLVLLDEPTNGLDIPSKSTFRRAVAEALTDDRVFVISTHQVRDLGALIDPIVILHEGRVLLNRTLAEIGQKLRMTHTVSPPASDAPNLLLTEPGIGGFWSVWRETSTGDGPFDLEVLFNAVVAKPELTAGVFANVAGAS
jgi:ABC-2 type transport system ATP-binding protein